MPTLTFDTVGACLVIHRGATASALHDPSSSVIMPTHRPHRAVLFDLPSPLLGIVLASSGSGAAAVAASCRAGDAAWCDTIACPLLAARFLLSRYGAATALFHVYGNSNFRDAFLREIEAADQDAKHDAADVATARLVRRVLRGGAALHTQARFLLTAAASAGHTRVVRTLVTAGVNAAAIGGRALTAAAGGGHLPVIRALISAGTSPRADNGAPLIAACRAGHPAAAQVLLGAGADARAGGGQALVEAARGGNLALVSALLAAGADPRVGGGAALLEAATAGHVSVVAALAAAGARPGPAALKAATARGDVKMAMVLRMAAGGRVGEGRQGPPVGCGMAVAGSGVVAGAPRMLATGSGRSC